MSENTFRVMFNGLASPEFSDDELIALAATMIETRPRVDIDEGRVSGLKAGYTYLAQFIDHDITFDQTVLFHGSGSLLAKNTRTPRLDLDSLYGGGPSVSPKLFTGDGCSFSIRENSPTNGEDDLVRGVVEAVIGDRRNDSNLIISQMHLAFLKFHNNILKSLNAASENKSTLFVTARQTVCKHYQWIVLNEFLPLLAGTEIVAGVLKIFGRKLQNLKEGLAVPNFKRVVFDTENGIYMPLEFSIAAFRFGHSMVRHEYFINQNFGSLVFIFDSTKPDDDLAVDLRGFRSRPRGMKIDWSLYFDGVVDGLSSQIVQLARPIDPLIASPMTRIPTKVAGDQNEATTETQTQIFRSVPARNLWRSRNNNLPSGQSVAEALDIPETEILGRGKPFEIDQVGVQGDLNNIAGTGLNTQKLTVKFNESTPLWYYILKEASVFNNGEQLGPVGARLVTEVLIGLLAADPNSILNSERGWVPELGKFGCRTAGEYRMADLLAFSER